MKDKKKTASLIIFIVSSCIMVFCLGFFLYNLIVCINGSYNDESSKGLGLATIMIILITYGSIIFGISMLLYIVAYFTHRKSEDYHHKKLWNVIYLIFIFVSPLIELALLVSIKLLV